MADTTTPDSAFPDDVCVVGGCGHVGLPLAITLADAGFGATIHDINDAAVAAVAAGRIPFLEAGAEAALRRVLAAGRLQVANDPALISRARCVIVVVGTPVDEHLNPTYVALTRFFKRLLPQLRPGQCVILRSTVFPGTTGKLAELVRRAGLDVSVAFCPERVAEGKAMEELKSLPQIISGCDPRALVMAREVFGRIARELIELPPLEAELTKIFTNAWRYIEFAIANQMFMIAAGLGADFHRVYAAMTHGYPRMAGVPSSGFAAGPCLFKDTMQLAALARDAVPLGHAAMLVNEGLPNFLVGCLKQRLDLSTATAGVLGMAFKAGSDDPRESLSYKLRKVLEYEAGEVLCSDVHIQDPSFVPPEELINRSDVIVVATPHREYRGLVVPDGKVVADVWNLFGRGAFWP